MALYYLPCLVRSDRYFITRLEPGDKREPDFNFVIGASDRILTPLITLEDPDQIVLTQLAPQAGQDIPLKECHISVQPCEDGFELLFRRSIEFKVDSFIDEDSGLRLDYLAGQKRITLGIYQFLFRQTPLRIRIRLELGESESFSTWLEFLVVRAEACQHLVIDFGSEASQVAYRNGGPQSAILPYDLLGNMISCLRTYNRETQYRREDFLNHEPGQPNLYRSFYAVRKKITPGDRKNFPFNFTDNPEEDEIRLFISRAEVAATEHAFHEQYEIIPNLKLGIEKSLQLEVGDEPEDYSIISHKQELISAIILRLMRLILRTKPEFRSGGLQVTLLVPNIYTQQDVFGLLGQLRQQTAGLLRSLGISHGEPGIEYETISESDAAFMGYQQMHPEEVKLSNGEIALVIDCGKGTTDISMLLTDDNENYSSFFRTGFAAAGNVLLYGFAEDYLTLALRAIPGNNDISIKNFISRHILDQQLTADVLQFVERMEDQKRMFGSLRAVSLTAFAELEENSPSTERRVSNLHRDPATVLNYTDAILRHRNIRWDEEVTGLIHKAADCIVHSIVSSIRNVITRDVRKRIKLVMLSGRAFYFDILREKLEHALRSLLPEGTGIKMLPTGRQLNNKNIALYGAFSGAYKITDFTGIPVDRKKGLAGNNDVLNNNLLLYRGLKIDPGNDILYNTSVARRNNQVLKAFKNKTMDLCFTRDDIYLRLMENQRVKYVRSLYTVLTPLPENFSSAGDLKALSMFPHYDGEMTSLADLHRDLERETLSVSTSGAPKRKGVLSYFQFW